MNKTPEQIKAFLDDLARLSLKHSIVVNGRAAVVEDMPEEWHGYKAWSSGELNHARDGDKCSAVGWDVMGEQYFGTETVSLDPMKLSVHEKMKIIAGQ